MQSVKLNNGVQMPQLGFGVYQMTDPAETRRALLAAIEAGYRLIDTAQAYGNEAVVGEAIRESGVPREEFFITTKLWITHTTEAKAPEAFAASMRRLGLDYLDLYLIHQPFNDVYGAWRAMNRLMQAGDIRAIGVSNFSAGRLADLISFTDVVPAVNQVETHVFCQQTAAVAYMQEKGVQIESWGPFAEGRNNFFQNPVMAEIARTHGKSVAQVALRFLIERGVVVIPKSVHAERITENLQVFDFSLSAEEMARLGALDLGKSLFLDHDDPKTIEWLAHYKAD